MTRLDRQSFLGNESVATLRGATIGLAGLGGGGSHLAQQFAHIGIGGYVLADDDVIEDTNTNRLVSGTLDDVAAGLSKIEIAVRTIRSLVPDARIVPIRGKWQDAIEDLKSCDIIMGAVDGFAERAELERFCRRHLIPYIDVGMDVHPQGDGTHLIGGQVILSSPGGPCLRCCGFITDEKLAREAEKYGSAGARPQVVWPNGVLASTAVGLAVQLLTPWFRDAPSFVYLEYDGNRGTMKQSGYMQYALPACPHHPAGEVGDPLADIRLKPMPADKLEPVSWSAKVLAWAKGILFRLKL